MKERPRGTFYPPIVGTLFYLYLVPHYLHSEAIAFHIGSVLVLVWLWRRPNLLRFEFSLTGMVIGMTLFFMIALGVHRFHNAEKIFEIEARRLRTERLGEGMQMELSLGCISEYSVEELERMAEANRNALYRRVADRESGWGRAAVRLAKQLGILSDENHPAVQEVWLGCLQTDPITMRAEWLSMERFYMKQAEKLRSQILLRWESR